MCETINTISSDQDAQAERAAITAIDALLALLEADAPQCEAELAALLAAELAALEDDTSISGAAR